MDDEMREVIATPCADKPKVLAGQMKSEMQETDQAFVLASRRLLFFFPPICIPAPKWTTGSQPALVWKLMGTQGVV